MNITVYYPKNPQDLNALHKKVAIVHAQAVIRYSQQLSCPKEQKRQLLKELIESRLQ